MRVSAIIVAAGSGRRLGGGTPKAFVPLGGRPMLYYSMRALADVELLDEVVVALPAGKESAARTATAEAGLDLPVKLTVGGCERQDSVRIALGLVSAESALVVVHDAARPFALARLFDACIRAASAGAGAIAALPLRDTLKLVEGGGVVATRSRSGLYQAQTPQAFSRHTLIEAHRRAYREQLSVTDDAELVERMGARVEIVEGSALNFKVTTTEDLELAEALVALYPQRWLR